jgi:hypothetical protein
MMVVYDPATGSVSQAIMTGDFDALQTVYKANGATVLVGDYEGNPAQAYVENGVISPRPVVQVGGTVRNIAADGQDTLELTVSPASFTLSIIQDGDIIHTENDTSGALSFSTDQPGTYLLKIDAAWPYFYDTITVVAS